MRNVDTHDARRLPPRARKEVRRLVVIIVVAVSIIAPIDLKAALLAIATAALTVAAEQFVRRVVRHGLRMA